MFNIFKSSFEKSIQYVELYQLLKKNYTKNYPKMQEDVAVMTMTIILSPHYLKYEFNWQNIPLQLLLNVILGGTICRIGI